MIFIQNFSPKIINIRHTQFTFVPKHTIPPWENDSLNLLSFDSFPSIKRGSRFFLDYTSTTKMTRNYDEP